MDKFSLVRLKEAVKQSSISNVVEKLKSPTQIELPVIDKDSLVIASELKAASRHRRTIESLDDVCIDPEAEQEILSSIEECYFTAEKFESSLHELKKLSSLNVQPTSVKSHEGENEEGRTEDPEDNEQLRRPKELEAVKAQRQILNRQLSVVTKKVYDLIAAKQHEYTEEISNVFQLERKVSDCLSLCVSTRNSLSRTQTDFTLNNLRVLECTRKRNLLTATLARLSVIRTLRQALLRLDHLLSLSSNHCPSSGLSSSSSEVNDLHLLDAIRLSIECRSALRSHLSVFNCVRPMSSQLSVIMRRCEKQLDEGMISLCIDFAEERFLRIEAGFEMLEQERMRDNDTRPMERPSFLDVLVRRFVVAIDAVTYYAVLRNIPPEKRQQFNNVVCDNITSFVVERCDKCKINMSKNCTKCPPTLEDLTPMLTEECYAICLREMSSQLWRLMCGYRQMMNVIWKREKAQLEEETSQDSLKSSHSMHEHLQRAMEQGKGGNQGEQSGSPSKSDNTVTPGDTERRRSVSQVDIREGGDEISELRGCSSSQSTPRKQSWKSHADERGAGAGDNVDTNVSPNESLARRCSVSSLNSSRSSTPVKTFRVKERSYLAKLESNLVHIWLVMQTKFKFLLSSFHWRSTAEFDGFLRVLQITKMMIETGELFCSKRKAKKIPENFHPLSTPVNTQADQETEFIPEFEKSRQSLESCLAEQCEKFFAAYHEQSLLTLKTYLEHESWELMPVRDSFTLTSLHEYCFLQNDKVQRKNFPNDSLEISSRSSNSDGNCEEEMPTPYSSICTNSKVFPNIFISFESSSVTCGDPFEAVWEEAAIQKAALNDNSLFEDVSEDDEASLDGGSDHQSSAESSSLPKALFPSLPSHPLTNSSLMILRLLARYASLLSLLQGAASPHQQQSIPQLIVVGLVELYEFYLAAVYSQFVQQNAQMFPWGLSSSSWRVICRLMEEYGAGCEVGTGKGGFGGEGDKPKTFGLDTCSSTGSNIARNLVTLASSATSNNNGISILNNNNTRKASLVSMSITSMSTEEDRSSSMHRMGDGMIHSSSTSSISDARKQNGASSVGGVEKPLKRRHRVALPIDMNGLQDDSTTSNLYNLKRRVAACESLAFLSSQMQLLLPHLSRPLATPVSSPEKSDRNSNHRNTKDGDPSTHYAIDQFTSCLECSSDLYLTALLSLPSNFIEFHQILSLMSAVSWDLKDIQTQHSEYVDILLINLFNLDKTLRQHQVPESVLRKISHCSLKFCARLFIEGFASARKCSNAGRALMQLDFQQFLSKIEKLSCSLKPIPDQTLVEQLIRAYYLIDEPLAAWITDNFSNFTRKQLLGLIGSMGHVNRRWRTSLIQYIEETIR